MAARFWIGGGTNANWNASPTTNWCATSGGTVRVAAPTSADDVTFDGAGATGNSNATLNGGTCLSLTFTSGYTATTTITGLTAINTGGSFTDNTAHTWSGTGTLLQLAGTITVNSGGKTLSCSVFTTAATITLTADWTVAGSINSNSTNTAINGAFNLTCGGIAGNASTSGTATIIINNGTWSGTGGVANPIVIQGTSSITVNIIANNITCTSGTVTLGGTHTTLTTNAASTFNTPNITWNNITLLQNTTCTLNGLLLVSGTLTTTATTTQTFNGTTGFTVNTWAHQVVNANTVSLKNSITYTVTTSLQVNTSRIGSIQLITSDDATLKANLVLQNNSTLCNCISSFTRINASGGRPINTFGGTITDCINIYAFTNVLYKPVTSFNRGVRKLKILDKNKEVTF